MIAASANAIINSGLVRYNRKKKKVKTIYCHPCSFMNFRSIKQNSIKQMQKSETKGHVVICSLESRKRYDITKAINGWMP